MIDSHSHIFLEEFDDDRADVVLRAKAAGVERIVLPNVDVATIGRLYETAAAFPDICVMAMGLHPTSVTENYLHDLEIVEHSLDAGRFVAIGEVGMDLYWDKTFAEQQKDALRRQVQWAIDRNMPLILHVRDAFAETVEVLREFPSERLRGVFHSFTGTPDEAAVISSLGDFKLGINGVVTFKKSDWREALPFIGLENLLLETDCPYLTPVPYRGRRNESAYVAYVCQKLAEIFGVSVDEVDRLTTENAKRLFGL